MSKLTWDGIGERLYETGVDQGVLYILNTTTKKYDMGYAWNGLTNVSENPEGAESNPQYADNIKYVDLISAEEFKATIEAFTYPDEFAQCDGSAELDDGITVSQQARATFGLCYRTRIGNDVDGDAHGYKLHLIYGCKAAPSEKAYATVNDSPEAITFSWEVSTTPVPVGDGFKPTSKIEIDSTKADPDVLAELLDLLYGTDATTDPAHAATDPQLPLPEDIIDLIGEG